MYFDTVEHGPGRWHAIVYWGMFLLTIVFIPDAFPAKYPYWQRVLLVVLIYLGCSYQIGEAILGGTMRLLRGQAEVQLSPKGFTIQRRDSVKILPWSRVKDIEVWQYDEPEQRLILFFFK